jgi:hypothetical protein
LAKGQISPAPSGTLLPLLVPEKGTKIVIRAAHVSSAGILCSTSLASLLELIKALKLLLARISFGRI